MSLQIGRKYLLLLVSLLSANPRALADTIEFSNGKTMKTEHINPQENVNNLQFGFVKVNYTSAEVAKLKIDDKQDYQILPESIFVTEAYASTTPFDQNLFTAGKRAHNAIRSAMHFEDVRPFLSKKAYESLISQKDSAQGKEILILQLLKTSIPGDIDIIQTQSKGDLAWVVARGSMNGKMFWGIISLVNEDHQWKLLEETWYGNENKPVVIKTLNKADDFPLETTNISGSDFIHWVDQAAKPRSTLPLEYGRIKTPKKSFCFFFFLDPQKTKNHNNEKTTLTAEAPTPDVHIVWPTGFRHDPKVYEGNNDEGFDVSVAADKDGYYPNKVNLRMPRGKPREIYIGFLLTF